MKFHRKVSIHKAYPVYVWQYSLYIHRYSWFEDIISIILSVDYAKFENKALYPEKIEDISFTLTTRDV